MTTAVPLPRIGAPATRALAQHGVLTMDDLKGADLNELSKLHGVGPKTIKLLQAAVGEQQAP
ncbi:DNA-binding protein [Arthrobacter cheniae]|uniref:DNA-binding protein n=1 Tax=Arthrobacter cheniae TaxID=1258888 RepID=A0A3A5M0U5_9MICC|nr:helix-hairpin-helix domain-containing protein [Arthrobacter cheniae]RJT79173.1 DNA-binding protein [Arthrobacter cheniae]